MNAVILQTLKHIVLIGYQQQCNNHIEKKRFSPAMSLLIPVFDNTTITVCC
uniref:Uncharacterized protein n=1 Tax=Arundo donax TaxID=35708 RepID=A0A0A9F108_ARUDO